MVKLLSPAGIGEAVKSFTVLGSVDEAIRVKQFIGKASNGVVSAFVLGSGKIEKIEIEPTFKPSSKKEIEKLFVEAYNDAIVQARKFHDETISGMEAEMPAEVDDLIENYISRLPQTTLRRNPVFPADLFKKE